MASIGTPTQFSIDVSKFVAKAKGSCDQVVRKVVIDLSTRVIMRSPVKTGRFRANWMYGESVKPQGTTTATDKAGGATISTVVKSVKPEAAGKVHWLTNNLPYARRLEDGWSKQAPSGMVGLTVVEFQSVVDRAVKELP